jgi:alpha-beta hydrolase superfamily lysophospholipase
MGGNTVSKDSGLRAVVAPAAWCVNLRYAHRSMPLLRYLLPRSVLVRVLLAVLVVGGLSTGCTTLEEKERELTFRAQKADAGWFVSVPESVQDVYLPVSSKPDAPRIHAWWWPDANPDAPVVYYLHGVRWNLTGNLRRIEQWRQMGFAVFAIDYRGFGKSDGDLPSEQMVYEDADAGWQWLVRRQPDPSRRVIYGHSLGGAVAIDLAARLAEGAPGEGPQARGLIVESSFTTLADAAAEITYGWLPTNLILTQKFDSIRKIRQVDMPVLVVHGAGDRFLPSRFSEALYRAAPGPKKRLLLVENGSHNNSLWVGNGEYKRAVSELFELRDPAPAAGAAPALSPVAARPTY